MGSAVNPNISGGMFWRLMLGTVAMLAFGYLGESGNMNSWLGFWLGMAGWGIYPLGYFFGYLLHQWGDSPCNFTYNIADFVNKIAFCLAIWHAGRRDTLQGQGH